MLEQESISQFPFTILVRSLKVGWKVVTKILRLSLVSPPVGLVFRSLISHAILQASAIRVIGYPLDLKWAAKGMFT